MNTWVELVIAIITLVGSGVSAYQQVRKRYRLAPVNNHELSTTPSARPVLNGFTEVLQAALDKLEGLRRENETLRLRIAELELEAARAAKPVSRPRRTTKSAVVGG